MNNIKIYLYPFALVPLGMIYGIVLGWQAFHALMLGGSWCGFGFLAVVGYAVLMALPLAGILAFLGLPFLTVWLCCSFVTLLFYKPL